MKKYRTNGAIGALLDEYEKALNELIAVIDGVSREELLAIVDPDTKDADCRSIQSILSHVVRAGYVYVIVIRRHGGEDIAYPNREYFESIPAYVTELQKMFAYNVALFDQFPDLPLEAYESEQKIRTTWGQRYDVDQLFEHAIVHILRHRRQIERFLLKLR